MTRPQQKECSSCRTVKPLVEFYRNHRKRDGLEYSCKDCKKAYVRKCYRDDPEKAKAKDRHYQQSNKEKVKESKKRYRDGNKEKIKKSQKRYREQNKEKRRQADREYRKKNKGALYKKRHTAARHLEKYGLTLEAYNSLLASQGGVCALCGVPPNGKRLCVDHCHNSLAVRGLLCSPCNRSLGQLGDTAVRLQAAANYLASAEASRLQQVQVRGQGRQGNGGGEAA